TGCSNRIAQPAFRRFSPAEAALRAYLQSDLPLAPCHDTRVRTRAAQAGTAGAPTLAPDPPHSEEAGLLLRAALSSVSVSRGLGLKVSEFQYAGGGAKSSVVN